MMMFPEEDLLVGRSLDVYGEFQQLKVNFLESLVSPGDVAIDVGANIGSITVPLAKKIGSEGYVLSLEAHSMLFMILCGNLAANDLKQVQCFQRAASDKTGSLFYFPHLDFSKNANFGGIKLAGLLNSKEDDRVYDNPVTAVAIDDLGIAKPKLIKISANGMEPVVLNGLRKTIKRSKPILYVSFSNNYRYILEYLASIGYDWQLHETPYFNPNNFQNVKENIFDPHDSKSLDIVCWHRDEKPNFNDLYFVDLDSSVDSRHIKIKEIRDDTNTGDFDIESD